MVAKPCSSSSVNIFTVFPYLCIHLQKILSLDSKVSDLPPLEQGVFDSSPRGRNLVVIVYVSSLHSVQLTMMNQCEGIADFLKLPEDKNNREQLRWHI